MIDTLLLIAAIIGLVAGGLLVARSPTFWFGLGLVAFKAAKPQIVKLAVRLYKPLSPQDQKKLDAARRMGQEWDFGRKMPRDR